MNRLIEKSKEYAEVLLAKKTAPVYNGHRKVNSRSILFWREPLAVTEEASRQALVTAGSSETFR